MQVLAKYKKIDSKNGFIFDENEIKHFVAQQKMQIIRNNLLGEYDIKGNYVIAENIVKELLLMPKFVVEIFENLYLIKSLIKIEKPFHFAMKVYKNKVSLLLLEKVNFGSNINFSSSTYSNINSCVIDEYKINDAATHMDEINRRYHIVDKPADGKVLDIFELSEQEQQFFLNILNSLKCGFVLQTKMLKKEAEQEKTEQTYFETVSAFLQTLPNFGAMVLNDFKKEWVAKKDFIKIDKPNFYATLNQLLEASLAKFESTMSLEEKTLAMQHILLAKKEYAEQMLELINLSVSPSDLELSYNQIKLNYKLATQQVVTDAAERFKKSNLENTQTGQIIDDIKSKTGIDLKNTEMPVRAEKDKQAQTQASLNGGGGGGKTSKKNSATKKATEQKKSQTNDSNSGDKQKKADNNKKDTIDLYRSEGAGNNATTTEKTEESKDTTKDAANASIIKGLLNEVKGEIFVLIDNLDTTKSKTATNNTIANLATLTETQKDDTLTDKNTKITKDNIKTAEEQIHI